MSPASKIPPNKQLEMIKNAAVECISQSSLIDFTMANIARLARLSMGSIYKFVQSKEDIVMALACDTFRYKSKIYEKALNMPLGAPEKMLAVSLINPIRVQCFEFDYDLETYATNDAVIRRASSNWATKMIMTSSYCEQLFEHTLSRDINNGALLHVPNMSEIIDEVILSGWSLIVGYEQARRVMQARQVIDGTDSSVAPLTIDDPIIRSMIRLLNSYPWKNPIDDQLLDKIELELQKLDLR